MKKPTMKKEINGKYVLLRRQKAGDIKTMINLLNDRDVYRFTHVPNPYTLKDAKESLQWVNKEWQEGREYEYLIIRKKTKDIIGKIKLAADQKNCSGAVGYMIGRPYRGQGYIYEASKLIMDQGFKTIKLNRIE